MRKRFLEQYGGLKGPQISGDQFHVLPQNEGERVEVAVVKDDEVVVRVKGRLDKMDLKYGQLNPRSTTKEYWLEKKKYDGARLILGTTIQVLRGRDQFHPELYYQAIFCISEENESTGGLLIWDDEIESFLTPTNRYKESRGRFHSMTMHPELGFRIIGTIGEKRCFINPATGEKVVTKHDISQLELFVKDDLIFGRDTLRNDCFFIAHVNDIPAVQPFKLPALWEEKK